MDTGLSRLYFDQLVVKKKFDTTTIKYQFSIIRKYLITLRLSSLEGEDCSILKTMKILKIQLYCTTQISRSALKRIFKGALMMKTLT